jgi:hypothetical protein
VPVAGGVADWAGAEADAGGAAVACPVVDGAAGVAG